MNLKDFGDTSLNILIEGQPFTLRGKFWDSRPHSYWDLHSSDGTRRLRYFFHEGQLLQQSFFDRQSHLLLNIMFPDDPQMRSELWINNGFVVRTSYKVPAGELTIINHQMV